MVALWIGLVLSLGCNALLVWVCVEQGKIMNKNSELITKNTEVCVLFDSAIKDLQREVCALKEETAGRLPG